MRKIIIIYLFFGISVLSKAQVSSSCTVPQILTAEYNKDIVQLATTYLMQSHNPDTVYVRIPQTYYDSVAGGLAAIFNAISIPERDSVYNLYCVHDHNGPPNDYAGFLIEVDTNYAWTHAWRSLNTMTGDAYIDNITSTYSLHVVNYYNWSFGQYAELATDSAWNIIALADTFELSPGVITAEPNYLIGMAGTIEYNVIGSDRYYNFYFEFNDCFDGCDNYHEWMFKVDANCTVTYLGYTDWGVFGIEPLPAPVNCNVFTGMNGHQTAIQVDVFPNPVSDKLNLHLSSYENSSVRIYDVTGREMKFVSIDSENTMVDVYGLINGIYLVGISNAEKTVFRKIVKGN